MTRTSQRGLTPHVIQHEVKSSKKEIAKAKGTVKATVLEGCDPLHSCPLVAASVYDAKGVHFLLTCVEKIDWVEKTRKTWDRESSTMRLVRFLRLTINDAYNNKMNNVDITDQLRGSYRPDRWMRKQWWFWSMFFWGHGTLLVNVYVAFNRFREMMGALPLSHYEFRKAVVLAKICPDKYGAMKQPRSIAFQRGDHRASARQPSKRSIAETESDAASASTRSSKRSKMAIYVTPQRMESDGSGFNVARLDKSLRHLPEPALRGTGGTCCALCRFVTGMKCTAHLLKCTDCVGKGKKGSKKSK